LTSAVTYEKRIALPFGMSAPAVTIAEYYFECPQLAENTDVVACLFQNRVFPSWRSYEGATRIIDLTSDLDSILAGFTKGTRYEIKRASQRDGTEALIPQSPSGRELGEFINHYDRFAASKGVAKIRREQLYALADAGKLALSVARGADNSILAAHAYVVTLSRARLTHSASLFRAEPDSAARAQVGRANRFLHWNDLVAFHAMGVKCYDFGGWYQGSRDMALLNINAFKQEFGGRVVKEWNLFRGGSFVGATYLTMRDLMLRTRR
jgi:hypothetical protein